MDKVILRLAMGEDNPFEVEVLSEKEFDQHLTCPCCGHRRDLEEVAQAEGEKLVKLLYDRCPAGFWNGLLEGIRQQKSTVEMR